MIDDNSVKIPFWRIVGNAYGILLRNLKEFFRLAWLLMVITYGINFGLGFYASITQEPYWLHLGRLTQVVTLSIFAVAWHRMLLLDEFHTGKWAFVTFGKRDLLFILTSLVFTLLIYGLSFILGAGIAVMTEGGIGEALLGGFLSLIIFGIIGTRFVLIYPIIAIDNKFSLKYCWLASKGNAFRLYFGGVLVMMPLILASSVFVTIAYSTLRISGEKIVAIVALEFMGLALLFGAIAVAAGFLSLSFKILCPNLLGSQPEELILKNTDVAARPNSKGKGDATLLSKVFPEADRR